MGCRVGFFSYTEEEKTASARAASFLSPIMGSIYTPSQILIFKSKQVSHLLQWWRLTKIHKFVVLCCVFPPFVVVITASRLRIKGPRKVSLTSRGMQCLDVNSSFYVVVARRFIRLRWCSGHVHSTSSFLVSIDLQSAHPPRVLRRCLLHLHSSLVRLPF